MERRGVASASVRLVVVLIAVVCALLSTNNWCFVVIPAALAGFALDYFVCAIRPRIVVRVPVAAVVGIVIGLLLNVRPGWAFREAFETEPPAGIRNVRIWRHYLGGPGEHALIIAFTVDAAALETLVRAPGVAVDSDRVARWRDASGEWSQAFDIFVGPGPTQIARSSWRRAGPLEQPEVFDLGESNGGRLVLFHEARTGRCVALHVRF